ncbi:MAG: extracellular solute-binding protein, partial [Maritimibacter sp.]|nr:extracellular solute-binding protein [Maritimibacter sp.]
GYWNGNGLKPAEDYDFFEFPAITDGVANAVVGPVDGLVVSANAANVKGAEELVTFLVADKDVQGNWAQIQGALSANVNVDPAIYTPVMKKALDTIKAAQAFAFNYDLATPPPVAEVGLSMFAKFMDDPSGYEGLLQESQTAAAEAFKQ